MAKRDYYDVLGVQRGADEADVKRAFRRKARKLHPDHNPNDPKAAAEFKEINEAYEILKDADKKAAYDQFGHAAFEGGMGGGPRGQADFNSAFSDVFEDIFSDFMGGGGGRRRGGAQRGSDLRYNLSVSLEDAYNGKQTTIRIPGNVSCDACSGSGAEGGVQPIICPTCQGRGKVRAQQGFFTIERTCPTCQGRGRIVRNPCKTCSGTGMRRKERTLNVGIPAGVDTGTRIRLEGKGDAGPQGAAQGDLYIFITVEEHGIFERDGANLFCRIPVPMTTAALGGDLEAPLPDGGRSRVKVPSGVQTGKRLRLRGKGMPVLQRTGQWGDLFIELSIETPVNLSARQKELLREFEKTGADNSPESSNFFGQVKEFWNRMKS